MYCGSYAYRAEVTKKNQALVALVLCLSEGVFQSAIERLGYT